MAIELKNEQDKFSYALGMNISASVLQLPLDVNKEVIIQCVTDLLNGAQPQLEEKEYHQIMQDFQKKLHREYTVFHKGPFSLRKSAITPFFMASSKSKYC